MTETWNKSGGRDATVTARTTTGHLLVATGCETGGRVRWTLSIVSRDGYTRKLAWGRFTAATFGPGDIARDLADRALCAAWRKGLS